MNTFLTLDALSIFYDDTPAVQDFSLKIARGDFNVRVKKKRDDEIGQLCDTINDMAAELQNSEQMKNDFISSSFM